MKKFDGVANTLFVPLVARINVSKKFPEYFKDLKALELERYLPEGASRGSFEYTDLASAARYFNMDQLVQAFAARHKSFNLVYLGAGFETAYDRLNLCIESVNWYQVDLPDVISARKAVLGQRENEVLIAADMFKMEWAQEMDTRLPTLLVVSGVVQYFYEEEIVAFIRDCSKAFPLGEMIFDSTSASGLKYTNWFIRQTGNADALMHFGISDSQSFVDNCGVELVEERTFFPDALRILNNKLNLMTKIFMNITEAKKRLFILHIKLNPAAE